MKYEYQYEYEHFTGHSFGLFDLQNHFQFTLTFLVLITPGMYIFFRKGVIFLQNFLKINICWLYRGAVRWYSCLFFRKFFSEKRRLDGTTRFPKKFQR